MCRRSTFFLTSIGLPLALFIWALGGLVCKAQDSLTVRGWLPPQYTIPANGMGMQIQTSLEGMSWDSTWHRFARLDPVVAWSKGPLGQAQIQTQWPRSGDSLTVEVTVDSTGLTWRTPNDTLLAAWSSPTGGCFPVTPHANSVNFAALIQDIPFESKREDISLQWIQNQCLRTTSLKLILDSFDDENRRLTLIRKTNFHDLEAVGSLDQNFTTSYYREAFTLWWTRVR